VNLMYFSCCPTGNDGSGVAHEHARGPVGQHGSRVLAVQTEGLDTRKMRFDPASKDRLTDHDLARFPDDTLFHRLARAVCHACCLPRKELFEAWETARRVRRVCRGGRVVDLGGGHGLVGRAMLLLDDSSPEAIVVDTTLPPSSARLHEVLAT